MFAAPSDLRELYLFFAIGNYLMVLLLFVFGFTSRRRGSPFFYAASKLCQATGLTFLMFRDYSPEAISVILGNGLLIAGFGLDGAFAVFLDVKPTPRERSLIITAISIPIVGICALYLMGVNAGGRIVFFSGVLCLFLAATGVGLLKLGERTRLRVIASAFCFLLVVPLAFRLIEALRAVGNIGIFTISPAQMIMVLLFFLYMPFTTITYLLLGRESLERELILAATKDYLTGIDNRMEFLKVAGVLFKLMVRQSSRAAVLMADLDNFKAINDSHGHLAGDAVLKRFARIIGSVIRGQDALGRYGGDEFVVFLPNASTPEAVSIAERIRSMAESDSTGDPEIVEYTASIGVASVVANDNEEFNDLIRAADEALYRAKEFGRNRVIAD